MTRSASAMVSIVLKQLGDDYCEFVLEGVTPAVANALRRTLLADVPTLAIDEVVVIENSSVLFDEILAHRLALIPIRVDRETYEALLQCYEEGKRDECTATFTLEVEAERQATVYSGHMKFSGFSEGFAQLAGAAEVKPVSDLIPIVKLAPGQKVILEAYAKMGTGREHAKWQPVSVAAYKYYPVIKVLKEACDACERCAQACPRGILRAEGGKLEVVQERIEECTMCRACEEACPDVVKVSWDTTKFIYRVEGVGVLPVKDVVEVAVRRVLRRINAFVDEVQRKVQPGGRG